MDEASASNQNGKLAKALASLYIDEASSSNAKNSIDTSEIFRRAFDNNETRSQPKRTQQESKLNDLEAQVESQDLEHDDIGLDLSDADPAWIGTSPINIQDQIELHKSGKLQAIIAWREHTVKMIRASPYDPSLWVDLAMAYQNLGFSDISAASAYKALILCRVALDIEIEGPIFPANLKHLVLSTLSTKFRTDYFPMIKTGISASHTQAMNGLLSALMSCRSYYEGWVIATHAIKELPGQSFEVWELLFRKQYNIKRKGYRGENAKAKDKSAKDFVIIHSKKYPWMDEELFKRPAELVEFINDKLKGAAIKVKSCYPSFQEGDVGPLGLFATRDIKPGEFILVDRTALAASEISPTTLEACELCNSLLSPSIDEKSGWSLACCSDVKYCSEECRDTAEETYHKVLCQNDWRWLYDSQGKGIEAIKGRALSWEPRMFLRAFALIHGSKDFKNENPLTHHLLRRLTANYPAWKETVPATSGMWHFSDSVIAPMRILQTLKVDVWKDENWTPEVIQTLLWRLDNNANSSKTYGSRENGEPPNPNHIVSINPNYIFFNHSCEPNVVWHGGPIEVEQLQDQSNKEGENDCFSFARFDSSSIICRASRNVERGEELKISYIGDPMGKEDDLGGGRPRRRGWLDKWFKNGCGCNICENENAVKAEEVRKLEEDKFQEKKTEFGEGKEAKV